MNDFKFIQGEDYYLENGQIVLTEQYLIKRGKCCGSGCRHCPFWPQHTKGNMELQDKSNKNLED